MPHNVLISKPLVINYGVAPSHLISVIYLNNGLKPLTKGHRVAFL